MWFLVERYLPGIDIAEVRRATGRLAATTAALAADGVKVRYLGSSFVPGEESCFCRFESDAVDAVYAACDRASFHYDRILRTEELIEVDFGLDHDQPTP